MVYSLLYKNNAQKISTQVTTIPLQIGIVLLGFTISKVTLIPIIDSYAIWVLFFIIFSFVISYILGRVLGLDIKLNILLASGLSICGATAIAIVGCMFTLSLVMKTIPVGITYASFAGLCIIATTIVGIYKFNQMPNLYEIIGLGLIVAGVLMVNLLGKTNT